MAMRYRKGEAAGVYTIRRDINTGMFAISYEAEDQHGRKVFLKQYKSPSPLVSWYNGYKQHQNTLKARITGNAQLAERTYEFLDMFEHKKAFIQVYGFIENGKDLKEYIAEGDMSNSQRFTFAALLLYTLRLFHAAGIVHTDLKPDNVYLMPSPARAGYNLKLIDFDFTVLDGKPSPWDKSRAEDGMSYCGTPHYMSPEHLRSEMPTDRSDVFTAAIICYELLTKGGNPFPEDENEYREAVLAGEYTSLDFIVEPIPMLSSFGKLLEKSFSPDAHDRPSIAELHEALLACRSCFSGRPASHSKQPMPRLPIPRPPTKPLPQPPPLLPVDQDPPLPPSKPTLPRKRVRLGLSMQKEDGPIDWFKTSCDFGSHSDIVAVKDYRTFCSGIQFSLRRAGSDWFIDPAPNPPKNMVVLNGTELQASRKLSDGDIIAHGSRKDANKRNIEPMVVHLEEW